MKTKLQKEKKKSINGRKNKTIAKNRKQNGKKTNKTKTDRQTNNGCMNWKDKTAKGEEKKHRQVKKKKNMN